MSKQYPEKKLKQNKMKMGFFLLCLGIGLMFGYMLFRPVPLVSVVMCVYNGGKAGDLHRSIPSILNQSYTDFEFILVDDGSSDNSWAILQEYAQKDKRIRLVRNDKNRGISYSRNRGNEMARGKYIMVMDQDDESLPDRILKQALFMENHPEIDVVATPSITEMDINLFNDPVEIKFALFFGNNFGHPNLMMRRSFLTENNIRYNVNYRCANDYDVLVQIRDKGGEFGMMQEVLFKYNGANYSAKKEKLCVSEIEKITSPWAKGVMAQTTEDLVCQVTNRLIKTKKYHHLFPPEFLEKRNLVSCQTTKNQLNKGQ